MIVKLPASYDVSHWKEIPNFKLVSPKPDLFITKATEAIPGYLGATDEKFQRFFEGMMEIEVVRGAFHFHRKSADPLKQAQHFVNTISKMDILPTDFLILDVEEGGEKASQLWTWLEYVRMQYPQNRRLIYSRKNILDAIPMTLGEREYFKQIETWTAGYPWFPDRFSTVPSGYVPDQSRYGKTVLWQYSAKGQIAGIAGDVDLNWIEPNFYLQLGSNIAGDVSVANFTGVCKYSGGAKVWKDVGMGQIGTIKYGDNVAGDSEKSVAGIEYIHITSPMPGWTKKQWFTITYVPIPTPEPTPEPTPTPSEYILYVKDGISRKFVPE